MHKPLTPLRNRGKKKEIQNLHFFTMSNRTDLKHQFCFWGGLETTAPGGQALGALGAPPGPRACPATLGVTPLHPPRASPLRVPPQSRTPLWQGNKRLLHNTEAAKRVCVNEAALGKHFGQKKGKKQAVVPRQQVIWNKAGRSKKKEAVSVQSSQLSQPCSPAASLHPGYCSSPWRQRVYFS